MEMIVEEVQPHGLPLIGMHRQCLHYRHVPRFFAALRMTEPAGDSRLSLSVSWSQGLPFIGIYRQYLHLRHVPRFFAPLRMTVPAGNSRLMSHICLSHGLRRPPPDGRIPPFHKRAKNIPYPAGIQRSRIGVVSHFRRSEGGQRYGR